METRLAKKKRLSTVGSAMKGMEPHADIDDHHIRAVFANDVIFRTIGDFLGTADLKILRQTCRLMLAKVNGLRKFTQNLKVTISDEAIEANILSQDRTIQWKRVKIVTNKTDPRHFSMVPTNSLVELELHHECDRKLPAFLELQRYTQIHTACLEFLKDADFVNLESLTIDLKLFMFDIPARALNVIVQKLKHFGLADKYSKSWGHISTKEHKEIQQNINELEGLDWSLMSLSSEVESISSSTVRAIGAIMVSSVNTLEEIKLASFDFTHLPQIHGVQFPRLKQLNMSLESKSNVVQFSPFLNLQPKLESLQLAVKGEIGPGLFDAIKTICSSNKLHTFELNGQRLATLSSAFDQWRFVQGMTGLKRFCIQLTDGDTNSENVNAILNYLPTTLERIDIRLPDTPMPFSMLTGFPNLTYLDAHDCEIQMVDDALQSICRTLTKLRILHFGERQGSYITDLGLTGESSEVALPDSGISLNNLKGLEVLQLYGCSKTTEQGLIKAVRFPELRVAKIDRVISDRVLLKIAKNNPSLEFVARAVEEFSNPPIFIKLLTINPRLTRIKSVYTGPGYPCYRKRIKCEVSHMPSYGVLSRSSNKSLKRRALSTMKMAWAAKQDDAVPVLLYSYNVTMSEQL